MDTEQSFDARLVDDMKAAMRAHDDVRVSAIRFLRSAAKNRQIELGHPLNDAEMTDIIRKQMKQRQDAVDQFRTAGRQDLVDKEQADLDVLREYMPRQMQRVEVETIARAVIAELGATGPADMRRVMPALVARLEGRADGRLASEVVNALLRRN
ncbi:MAG: GatB/YqeY domain-containing protein [Chloroflexota bacterium]